MSYFHLNTSKIFKLNLTFSLLSLSHLFSSTPPLLSSPLQPAGGRRGGHDGGRRFSLTRPRTDPAAVAGGARPHTGSVAPVVGGGERIRLPRRWERRGRMVRRRRAAGGGGGGSGRRDADGRLAVGVDGVIFFLIIFFILDFYFCMRLT